MVSMGQGPNPDALFRDLGRMLEGSAPTTDTLFSLPMAIIFAREVLEATIIIGEYRTIIRKAPLEEERKNHSYRVVWMAAGGAAALAVLVISIVAVVLAALGNELDNTAAEVIEGVSKIVAAACIAQLSIKIPEWLGIYCSKKTREIADDTLFTPQRLLFDVAWNIWREIAEIGVFLVPFFLDGELAAMPLSALVGIAVALALGTALYFVNKKISNKSILAAFMATITGLLAVGLFTGGCHEFEEVTTETPDVWELEGAFWSHKKFPMAVIKPFGYSASPTVLQTVCWWGFAALLGCAHAAKYWLSKRSQQEPAASEPGTSDAELKLGESPDGIDDPSTAETKVGESP